MDQILQIEVGLLQNFCTVFVAAPGRALLIDPAFEVDRLLRLLEAKGLAPSAVLLTHGHPDHIDGVPEVLQRHPELPVYVAEAEAEPVRRLCAAAGVPCDLRLLRGDAELALDGLAVQALATPGHTAGGTSYHAAALGAVATGDTLFVGSVGGTRFVGSDARALQRSLQRLRELPEETRIYPGHDYGATPTSTIGWEAAYNPALRR